MAKENWRTIWISDVHLGTRGCKAAALHAFLKSNRCETLYLVGDIIDGWRLSSSKWYWPSEHNKVVRQILRKSEKEGTRVVYITGNHDEFLREYIAEHDMSLGNIAIVDECRHETADGRTLWVMHGDYYDGVTRHHRWVAVLGDAAYNFLLWSNHWFNRVRRVLRLPYWSLSQAIKHKVKQAVSFIYEFEHTVAREAKKRGVDGVICGHIHHAEHKWIEGVEYYNCGDWVESCTALTEDHDGTISILRWSEHRGLPDNVVSLEERRSREAAG